MPVRVQAEVGAPSLESCLYSAPEARARVGFVTFTYLNSYMQVLAGEPCDEARAEHDALLEMVPGKRGVLWVPPISNLPLYIFT